MQYDKIKFFITSYMLYTVLSKPPTSFIASIAVDEFKEVGQVNEHIVVSFE